MAGFDFGAAIRKLLGDQSADVIPGVNYKQVANAGTKPVLKGTTENPYTPTFIPEGSIAEQNNQQQAIRGGGGGNLVDAQTAAAASRLAGKRGEIKNSRQAIMDAYNALFGDVDTLARTRAGEVEKEAGENVNKLTSQYTSAIPGIQSSYAALGAGDSTDVRDGIIKAKTGFDEGVAEVGKNKEASLSKIGSYVNENKGKWNAERDSVLRLVDRADSITDERDLIEAGDTVANKLGEARATRGTLATDEGARGTLSALTSDSGRFDSIKSSLDNVINSSLGGDVKAAAVQAIANSSDLTEEDKKKVQEQYGNVYNAPVAA